MAWSRYEIKMEWFFLPDEGPSLKTLGNYSHISAVLKPFWLFHFDDPDMALYSYGIQSLPRWSDVLTNFVDLCGWSIL